ncbi:hypothetical protein SFC07_06370 [Corynebacterium callunae]|uniref:hypothetical protein n=1 Tax=Corynebacterium callunae TaxID=1721 RepID=UPI003982B257
MELDAPIRPGSSLKIVSVHASLGYDKTNGFIVTETCAVKETELQFVIEQRQTRTVVNSASVPSQFCGGTDAFCNSITDMPHNLVAAMHPARLSSYESEWRKGLGGNSALVTNSAVASLYVWQVALGSAWYETLSYVEAVIRNSVDIALRDWNKSRGKSEDWLNDAAIPLATLVEKATRDSKKRAEVAAKRRNPSHRRHKAPVIFDDMVSQLDFGSIVHLFPQTPPKKNGQRKTGFSGRENLWIHGLSKGFPNLGPDTLSAWEDQFPPDLPIEVQGGYAIGHALERLRRLRNRISHHEQTFEVEHLRRLEDARLLLDAISPDIAKDLEKLDRVRRALVMRPSA